MNYQKLLLLQKIKLPNDILTKIKKDYLEQVRCADCYRKVSIKNCNKCNICDKWICAKDSPNALYCGQMYYQKENYYMCDICCWWEIS